MAPVEVFKSDHGIQFIKGASFGKLPLFPHLERSYSGSPLSWNPLNGDGTRNSPRFSTSSGPNSPTSFRDSPASFRETSSPHLSIMTASTPPVFDVSTPPYSGGRRGGNSPFSIAIPAHDPHLSTGADSPTTAQAAANRMRRPFSLPDNSSPSHSALRMSAATIGHVQSRQLRTSASSPASMPDLEEDDMSSDEVMMQQKEIEHEEERNSRDSRDSRDSREGEEREGDDMGITRRKPRTPRSPHSANSPSSPNFQRPSLRESREARVRKAKEEEMKEDKKLKKSFKDVLSGFFSKKASRG